jgi:diguanylate cyclase (GGDEF)-like protein
MSSTAALFENDVSSAGVQSAEKSQRRLQQRREMLVRQFASYALVDVILWIYAYAGTVSVFIPSMFIFSIVVVSGIFAVLSEIRFGDHFDDHFLTAPQTAVNIALQFGFLLAAPQIGYLFLTAVYVILGFAALRMTLREAAIALAFAGTGVAAIFLFLKTPITLPMATAPEWFAGVCLFVLSTAECAYFGLFGNAMRRTLKQRTVELKLAYQRIEQLAETDELTGLSNRRSIVKMLNEQISRGRRGTACSVALIDIDWFKRINDGFGHPVGDEVLRRIALTMSANIRDGDKIGRYGGEEFLLVLPDTTDEAAKLILERLRLIVAELDWNAIASGITATISAGIATLAPDDGSDDILARADRALYAAKAGGRNRIETT